MSADEAPRIKAAIAWRLTQREVTLFTMEDVADVLEAAGEEIWASIQMCHGCPTFHGMRPA